MIFLLLRIDKPLQCGYNFQYIKPLRFKGVVYKSSKTTIAACYV